MTEEKIDVFNSDSKYDLHKESITIILQTEIETAEGTTIYEVPEEYGRVVAF